MISPVILYVYETEGISEHGAEKTVWTKENGIIEGWRKLHNVRLHDL
jgi:hypothetical protein